MDLFSRIGFPEEIQSDLGTSFVSELTVQFLEDLGIKIIHSSPYHPQSNSVERWHRTMKRLLNGMCLEQKGDWDKYIPSVLFALRTTVHETTGFTPAELVYGRNLRTPLTILKDRWEGTEKENEETVIGYVFKIINTLRKYQEIAKQNEEQKKIKNKTYYDRKSKERKYEVGDRVLIMNPSEGKFSIKWKGPGEVIKQISDTNYLVRCFKNNNFEDKVYHHNMIKPYFQREKTVNEILVVQNVINETKPIETVDEILKASQLDSILSQSQIKEIQAVVLQFREIFNKKPGKTNLVLHDIELTKEEPIFCKPYRFSPRQKEILRKEINQMLEDHIIEEGTSDYLSPMILVEVEGKDPRPCVDYRKLNNITKTKFYPIPNIEERIERVAQAKYITILDLAKGYWQIEMTPRASRYATFVTPFGIYRPLRMAFGLRNAPFDFCSLMAKIFKDIPFACHYLDDIAVISNTWEEHVNQITMVLQIIKDTGLTVKPSKCKFAQEKVQYLGHMVGQGELSPLEAKIKAILDFPQPQSKTEIRRLIGMISYYRKYLPNISETLMPLTSLTKGKERKGKIIWNENCENAFNEIKKMLTTKPVLKAPNFDKPFILLTDASNYGIGVILCQEDEKGEEHPIVYLSRQLNKSEQNFAVIERECLAIYWGISKLKYYLDGMIPFKIVTDHNPLVYLRNKMCINSRITRWILSIQSYDFEVIHRKGKKHTNVDFLSRALPE